MISQEISTLQSVLFTPALDVIIDGVVAMNFCQHAFERVFIRYSVAVGEERAVFFRSVAKNKDCPFYQNHVGR